MAARPYVSSGFTKGSRWLKKDATPSRIRHRKPQRTEFYAPSEELAETSKVAGIAVWPSDSGSHVGLYSLGTGFERGENRCAVWWLCRRYLVSFPSVTRHSGSRCGVPSGFRSFCSLLASKARRGAHPVSFYSHMLLYRRIRLLGSAFYHSCTSTDQSHCALRHPDGLVPMPYRNSVTQWRY